MTDPPRTSDMIIALSKQEPDPENLVLRVLKSRPYRPVPGKYTFETVLNRIVKVTGYGTDASGEYVEIQSIGPYGAHDRRPLSCIRRLTEAEEVELSDSLRLFEPGPRRRS